jgi:hypothetical protein
MTRVMPLEGNGAHPVGLFPDNGVYNPVTDTWQHTVGSP